MSAGRTLQAWQADAGSPLRGAGGLSLDDELTRSPAAASWDQFKQPNVKSTYREDMYTTSLDTSSSFYRQHEKEAERIARRIEGSGSESRHVLEERGSFVREEETEEDAFSTVLADSGSGNGTKYVHPHRRGERPAAVVGTPELALPTRLADGTDVSTLPPMAAHLFASAALAQQHTQPPPGPAPPA